jgi:hypothetical protein
VSFSDAQEFLARALPWPEDGQGFVNIHWTTVRRKPDGVIDETAKPLWSGRASSSVAEAIRTIQWASKLEDTRDIYVCMSRQSMCDERTSKKGHKYRNAVRHSDNALSLKSFFIDVDVKEGAYSTTKEAVTAFGQFRRAANLPPPTFVVASGSGGFHAHWVLAEPISRNEWLEYSHKLVAAVKQFGLLCDTQCSIDAARVLRVPDTRNFKYEPPRDVRFLLPPGEEYSFERIKTALEPYQTGYKAEPTLPARTPITGDNDLAAGIEVVKANPVVLADTARECAFIREAIDTGGAAYDNPLWNLTTLISTFTEGGRQDAHIMACGHPEYSAESTDELYDRKVVEREKKNLGWPKCTSIAAGYSGCNVCPHRMDGKSPLNFSQANKPAVSNTIKPSNDLPEGYVRDADKVVYQLVQDAKGQTINVAVAPYPVTDGWLQRNPWMLNFTVEINEDITTQISIPFELLPTKEPFFKHVSNQGMNLQEHFMRRFKEFIMAWVDKLRQGRNSVVTSSPFGWVVNNGKDEGFSYGGLVYTPHGDRPAANTDPVLQRQYTPSGDRQPWIDAAQMITDQKRQDLNIILVSAFAAPLLRPLGEQGVLISAFSTETGIGKSTAVKVAQSVWGDPIRGVQSLSDTPNSVINKLGELKNLPLYWDELKSVEDTDRFVNKVLFQLTGGKEKSRLNTRAEQRHSGVWETLMLVASNEPLIDHVARANRTSSAGTVRMMEYTVTPGVIGQIDPTEASLKISRLKDNHGIIGRDYAEFLGHNHDQVLADVTDTSKRLTEKLKLNPDERFWRVCASSLIQGATYANQLGFTAIDLDVFEEYVCKLIGEMRHERKSQTVNMKDKLNVSDVMSRYLDTMRARNTLFTNRIHVSKGKPPANSISVQRDASRLDAVRVQVGLEDGLLRMTEYDFRDWLGENNYSPTIFMKAMEQEFGQQQVTGRMGSGTQYASGTQRLLQIQLAGTPLAEIAAKDIEPEVNANEG